METKHKEFKAFDKVLVLLGTEKEWTCDLYSHYDYEYKLHRTFKGYLIADKDIIPYKDNEHLVGTIVESEEEVKLEEGEYIMVSDTEYIEECGWRLRKFIKTTSHYFFVNDNIPIHQTYTFAIRFSDFNPNNMKETKKHILCVKNGKVVKY